MRASAVLAVTLVAGCATPPTDVSVRTYKVSGSSMAALERSLSIHGPKISRTGGRAFAAVETTFMHSFELAPVNGRCRYSRNGRVGLRSEVVLPEWRQRDRADSLLRARWDILSNYAVIHESGHIKISQKYARQLEGAYKRASALTCTDLEAQMPRIIQPIADAHVAEQDEFDRTDVTRFRRYLRRNGYTTGS